MKYINAKELGIQGKAFIDAPGYQRLTDKQKEIIAPKNDGVPILSKQSSGIHVDFTTNSANIKIKWTVKEKVIWGIIPPCASMGLDSYILIDNKWQYLAPILPDINSLSSEYEIMNNILFETYPLSEYTYSLNLPYCNEITDLEIGIDDDATITPTIMPQENPIVTYGTSICHGFCVSRPGKVYSNILRRLLNKEVCNLGFNGSARLEYELSDMLNTLEPSILIMDPMPNMVYDQLTDHFNYFYDIFRKNHKNTPIIFIEQADYLEKPIYSNFHRNNNVENKKNLLLEGLFAQWVKNDKNIYYIDSNTAYGDFEETFDGLHPNDIGSTRLAKAIEKVIIDNNLI